MKRLGRVLSLTLGLGVAVVLVGHFNYSVNTPVRIYADPGSSNTAFVESTTSRAPQVTWTISGHFVCTNYQTLC